MRATIGIYEHPELSASDVWLGKIDRTSLYVLAGALSLAATVSTLAVYRYAAGLGALKLVEDKCVLNALSSFAG